MTASLPRWNGNATAGAALAARALARLGDRLAALGISVGEMESSAGLPALWLDRGADHRPAAVLSTSLDRDDLREALASIRDLASARAFSLLLHGASLDPGLREELGASVPELVLRLAEVPDSCELRFQVNRALAPVALPPRAALRAPLEHIVTLQTGWFRRPARVYSLSSRGAFLLLDKPPRSGRRVSLEVPAGFTAPPRARGRVTFVNDALAPSHPELPPGVAVRFDSIDAIAAQIIDRLVRERLDALSA